MKTKTYRTSLKFLLTFALLMTACTANVPTETTIPLPTSTMDIVVLRSRPDYMAGCLELNSNVYGTQANYRGIYAGLTRDSDVLALVGEPLKINNLVDRSWEFEKFSVIFDKTVVTQVLADDDGKIQNGNLADMIGEYGCPEIIYAVDINEHPFGEYSRLLFTYPKIGFDFTIDNIPAKLSDRISATSYYVPTTFEAYTERFALMIPNASKPLIWADAVK